MTMHIPPKKYLIGGMIIIILIIGVVRFKMKKTASVAEKEKKESIFEEPAKEIPPVDASVKATLKGNTEAVMSIIGVPDGTDVIEYELIYDTDKGPEGAIGKMKVKGDKAETKITFGTCSSGVCRYHKITGPVNATFKFSGEYGDQILETKFKV